MDCKQQIAIAKEGIFHMLRLVRNGSYFSGIAYMNTNIILRCIQLGLKNDRCYIIGNGHSLSVNQNEYVTSHDPCMTTYIPKISKDHTVYAFYFTFEAPSLNQAASDLSLFVNSLPNMYKKIILVGHSKCGLCFSFAARCCKREISLVTISTPFFGTVFADKEISLYLLNFRLYKFIYNKIFSNHNVDKEITPQARLCQDELQYVCKNHINVKCELENLSDCQSIADIFFLLLDRYMGINGDGIVPIASQNVIGSKSITITSSHAASLKNALKIIEQNNLI